MSKYTNNNNIPLSVGVWLATDSYQNPPDDGKKYISSTGLLKSIRQTILTNRLPEDNKVNDVKDMVASRFGTALHDSIEHAWTKNHKEAMLNMGYPEAVIDRVEINPEPPLKKGCIPVYMEQRFYKEVGEWVVTGQFDFVGDGRLEDFKSTSTFTWTNNTKDDDYIMQGSIYRWGRPDIITQDVMAIQFIFKDWAKFKTTDPKYPQAMLMEKKYTLMSEQETESFIKKKLFQLDLHEHSDEKDLPLCTEKELWMGKSTYKYYKNPDKRTRATKNFDTPQEAHLRWMKDGQVGVVVEDKAKPTACIYCPAKDICSQYKGYKDQGLFD